MRDIKTLPNLLTADEVADYLRVSKTTVCRWFVHGKLPGFRIGRSWRVQRDDLELFIKQAQTVRELRQPTAEVDTIVPITEQNAES